MKRADDLQGVTVIVTRPREQAAPLCRALEQRGARAVRFPAMEIQPMQPPPAQRQALAGLGEGDWAVFTSANAVRFGVPHLAHGALPVGLCLAAVGAATGKALRRRGGKGVLVPRGGGDSESLLELLPERLVSGRDVAIVRGLGGRRVLSRELRRSGARVHSIAVYRRLRPVVAPEGLAGQLPRRGRIVTTVTSGELLNNLAHMIDAATLSRLQRSPLVVVSERVAGLARWSGFRRVYVAGGAGPEAMCRGVMEAVGSA